MDNGALNSTDTMFEKVLRGPRDGTQPASAWDPEKYMDHIFGKSSDLKTRQVEPQGIRRY